MKLKIVEVCDFFFGIFVALYLFIGFLLLFVPPNVRSIGLSFLLLIGIMISLLFIVNNAKIKFDKYIRSIAILCILYIIIQLVNIRSPLSVLYPLCNFLLGYILAIKNVKLYFLYIVFFIISCVLFYFLINGYNPNFIFENASRNLISVVMLFNSILIYYQEIKQHKSISFFPALLTLIFSIWAIGRSGILCSLFLFFCVLFYQLKQKNIYYRFAFLGIIFIIVGVVYNQGLFENIEIFNSFVRFEERGLAYDEDERSIMLNAYLSKIDIFSIFKGYNYFNDPTFQTWDFNVHNSYISCHALWGVCSIYFSVFLIKKLISFRRNMMLFFLSCIFLIRAFSDAVCFNGIYDFIIISILFYSDIKVRCDEF